MREEAVETYFKVLARNSSEDTEENDEKLEDSHRPNSNWLRHKYMTRVSLVHQPVR